nr:reverse transcriptase domain-containing protein [Tanacetum cinerariifolium]
MHGITNPELIKRLHDNIPKSVDEMIKGDFRNQQRSERRRGKFALLTKSPKEILALDKGKFKAPPPMTTPVEKRNNNKFCEFHEEVRHNTDECMHLKRQIEELIKNGKLNMPSSIPKVHFFRSSTYTSKFMPIYFWNALSTRRWLCFRSGDHRAFEWDYLATLEKVKCSASPIFIGNNICPIGHMISPLKPMRGARNRGDISNLKGNKHEAKPKEMHLWNRRRHVPGIQSEYRGNNEKSLPFFKTLKNCTKKSDFQWTAEAKTAFKEMKKQIAKLPTLTAPMEKEELIVYLTAAREAVSTVLMTKREAKQMPVYFVSRVLQVQTRTSVKGQILADFMVEHLKDDPLDMPMEAEGELSNLWTLFTDGSSCIDGSEAVANQVNRSCMAKEPGMIQYLEKVKTLSSSFKTFSIKQVLVEELKEKSINEAEVLAVIEEDRDKWMTSIYKYLMKETLPAEKEKSRVVRRKSGRMKAVIPTDIGMPTLRTAEIDIVQNDEALEINLDLLKERRDRAAICAARSKAKMEKYYNSKVYNTSFKSGDLV